MPRAEGVVRAFKAVAKSADSSGLAEIAEFFNVSSRRIHQIFNETLHVSPKQYISDLKIEKAKQILEKTSMPIIDIADALGYYSAYHFSSAFQRRTGCSPSAYRKVVRRFLFEPFFAFADNGERSHNDDRKRYHKKIAVAPLKLRHIAEIHTVPADYQSQRKEDH